MPYFARHWQALFFYISIILFDALVLGGRPKAAIADERLIAAHSFF